MWITFKLVIHIIHTENKKKRNHKILKKLSTFYPQNVDNFCFPVENQKAAKAGETKKDKGIT